MRGSPELSSAHSRAPSHGGLAEWTLSKEKWDSFVAISSSRKVLIGFWVALAIILALGFGLPLFLIYAGMPLGTGLVLLGICGSLAILFGSIFYVAMRGTMLWSARAPGIWAARGCVCPECFAPLTRYVDDRDSCGHGYILDDQPDIVRYLETLATASLSEIGRGAGSDALVELRTRAAKRGGRRKGGLIDLFSSFRSASEQWFGFDQPLWRRAVGHCVVIAVPAAIVLPFSLVGASAFVWVIGFAVVGERALAKSRYREKRGEGGSLRYRLLAMTCGFFAFLFPTTVAPMIGRNLPTNMLFTIGDRIQEANRDAFDVLASRPLSAQDQQRLADAMLPFVADWARGGGTTDRSRHAQHIAACVARGTLPERYAAALADATVFLVVDLGGRTIASDGEIVEVPALSAAQDLPITLRFDGNGFTTSPALGQTVGCLAELEIDGKSLWDARKSEPPQLAGRVTATVGLSDGQPNPQLGDHQVVVRGYICITPSPAAITAFHADGTPSLPPGSRGPWLVERRFTIRVR
jgi:hypothetical protein